MRRRPGISGLQRQQAQREAFSDLGSVAASARQLAMEEQLQSFQSQLAQFALKHRADINSQPAFRASFHKMCRDIGVDPLASNKGFWSEALGLGEFYFDLGVQVAEACVASRLETGGLIPLDVLVRRVNKRRGTAVSGEVSIDDVKQAIGSLGKLGSTFKLEMVSGKYLVRSVPGELSPDAAAAIDVAAQDPDGAISEDSLAQRFGGGVGGLVRAREALESFMRDGMAWVDDQREPGKYWYYLPASSEKWSEVL